MQVFEGPRRLRPWLRAALVAVCTAVSLPAMAQRGDTLDRAIQDLADEISENLVQIHDTLTESTLFYVVTAKSANDLYCDPLSGALTEILNEELDEKIQRLDREMIQFGFLQNEEDLGAISLEWRVSDDTLRLQSRLGIFSTRAATSAAAEVDIATMPDDLRVCLNTDERVYGDCRAEERIRLRTSPVSRGGGRAGQVEAGQEFEVLGAYDVREDGTAGALLLAYADASAEGSSRTVERMAFARGGIEKLREWEEAGICRDVDYGDLEPQSLAPQCLPWRQDFPEPNQCRDCPEMMVLPPGRFALARSAASALDPARLLGAADRTAVQRLLLAVGRTEVTLGQWLACVRAGACADVRFSEENRGRGEDSPVSVSWTQAQAYIAWLNSASACTEYRLPREDEWEYAARGEGGLRDPAAAYWWGDVMRPGRAVCRGCGGGETVAGPLPVGTGAQRQSRWRLFDMSGNLWEWTADCWTASPTPGVGCPSGKRVVKGGSFADRPLSLRVENRAGAPESLPHPRIGFRVVATEPERP